MRRLIVLLLLASSVFADDETISRVIGNYKFVITSSNYGMTHTLNVFRRDKAVWTLEDFMVKLVDSDSLGLPKDLTGDKVQDVIVQTYSGGAHCCFADYVLSLGTTFEVFDTLNHAGKWGDRDHDGLADVLVADLTLDYWKLPHSDSPMPVIVMEASAKGFAPAIDLTRKPEPSASEMLEAVRAIREAGAWRDYDVLPEDAFLPASHAELHRRLVELIYTGNAKIGMELVETAWPPIIHGKDQYILDLLATLRLSRYWPAISEMNQVTLFSDKR